MKRLAIGAALVSVALTIPASAQADPARPTPAEVTSSAEQICGTVNQDPDSDGVIRAIASLGPNGYTDLAGAYVVFHAIIYTCPQHGELVMDTMNSVVSSPDGCIDRRRTA
jgi:hypothetical protein